MVDAPDSKSGEGNLVRVRVSPALPTTIKTMKNIKNLTAVFSLFSTGITIVTNGTNRKQFLVVQSIHSQAFLLSLQSFYFVLEMKI